MLSTELPMRYNFTHFLFHNNPQKCITFSQDRSWQLTNLLYHVLRVDYYFRLATKIFLLQLKILTFLTSLSSMCALLRTPPCADIIASFWVMQVKTQDVKLTYLCLPLITVSFFPYLFISIHGKTLLIFMLLLTCLIIPINNVITQTIFMDLFTSRSLLTWGKTLRCLVWHLPQVFVCYLLSIDYIPLLLQTPYNDRLCFLLTRVRQVGEGPHPTVGVPYHLPLAATPPTIHNPIRAVLPDEPQGLGRGNRRSVTISLTCWYWLRRRPQGIGGMVFWPFGWTLVRPGSTLWRKWLGNWLPVSPVNLIGPMPWCG